MSDHQIENQKTMLWKFIKSYKFEEGLTHARVHAHAHRNARGSRLLSPLWEYYPHLTDKEIEAQSFAPAYGKEGTGTWLLPQRDSHGVQRSPSLHRDATGSPEKGG